MVGSCYSPFRGSQKRESIQRHGTGGLDSSHRRTTHSRVERVEHRAGDSHKKGFITHFNRQLWPLCSLECKWLPVYHPLSHFRARINPSSKCASHFNTLNPSSCFSNAVVYGRTTSVVRSLFIILAPGSKNIFRESRLDHQDVIPCHPG